MDRPNPSSTHKPVYCVWAAGWGHGGFQRGRTVWGAPPAVQSPPEHWNTRQGNTSHSSLQTGRLGKKEREGSGCSRHQQWALDLSCFNGPKMKWRKWSWSSLYRPRSAVYQPLPLLEQESPGNGPEKNILTTLGKTELISRWRIRGIPNVSVCVCVCVCGERAGKGS